MSSRNDTPCESFQHQKDHPLNYGGLVRLLELEEQHFSDSDDESYIKPLVGLYAKQVEFYATRGDMIKDYFMERIQMLATANKKPKAATQNGSKKMGKGNPMTQPSFGMLCGRRGLNRADTQADSARADISVEKRKEIRSRAMTFQSRLENDETSREPTGHCKNIINKSSKTFEINDQKVNTSLTQQEDSIQNRIRQRKQDKLQKTLDVSIQNIPSSFCGKDQSIQQDFPTILGKINSSNDRLTPESEKKHSGKKILIPDEIIQGFLSNRSKEGPFTGWNQESLNGQSAFLDQTKDEARDRDDPPNFRQDSASTIDVPAEGEVIVNESLSSLDFF